MSDPVAAFVSRLVVSLASAWFVVALIIVIGKSMVDRSTMGVVAGAGLVLGLIVAVVCWRATRNWAPRRATAEELANGLDIHFGYPYLTFLVCTAIPTLGLLPLGFLSQTRRWPKRMDPEGLTLRNGTRLSWSEIHDTTLHQRRMDGVPVNRWCELHAKDFRISIIPNALAEGRGALEFASKMLGQDLTVR